LKSCPTPNCRGYQQQDAHEFMRYLLDKLHTELLAGSLRTGSDNTTIVSQIFGGTLQSDVRRGRRITWAEFIFALCFC
jgi:ubiquitin C-terminal hydrolase